MIFHLIFSSRLDWKCFLADQASGLEPMAMEMCIFHGVEGRVRASRHPQGQSRASVSPAGMGWSLLGMPQVMGQPSQQQAFCWGGRQGSCSALLTPRGNNKFGIILLQVEIQLGESLVFSSSRHLSTLSWGSCGLFWWTRFLSWKVLLLWYILLCSGWLRCRLTPISHFPCRNHRLREGPRPCQQWMSQSNTEYTCLLKLKELDAFALAAQQRAGVVI